VITDLSSFSHTRASLLECVDEQRLHENNPGARLSRAPIGASGIMMSSAVS
jgi:hypothetical protein